MHGYMFLILINLTSSLIFATNKNNIKILNIYLIFNSIIFILFFGFRGDFTSDYNNYKSIFNYYTNFSFFEIFNKEFSQEKGYVILNKLVQIFNGNFVILQIIIGTIIVGLTFREIKKHSDYIWLSVLLYATLGQYYSSFNITRQIIASTITFSGSRYLYERNFKRYIIFVLIASSFHKSSFIMLLFYILLNLKSNKIINTIQLIFSVIIYQNIHKVLDIVRIYFYSNYNSNSYGMSGFNYKNIVLPLGILSFILVNKYIFKIKLNKKSNIWFNAVMYYSFFRILGTKVMMIERISNFFVPYVLLIVPFMLKNQRNVTLKKFFFILIVLLSICFNYFSLNNSGYDPYYFIF